MCNSTLTYTLHIIKLASNANNLRNYNRIYISVYNNIMQIIRELYEFK